MNDPTVRSIQVASALIDRVGVIMTGASRSGYAPNVDGLELRLGEAQQIVPEIWNHLASARDVLASNGNDVGAFDQIRGGLRVPLASTQIDIEDKFSWLSGDYETTKTVTWDVAGFRRAIAACETLKRLRADVDWAGLDREQAREIAAAGSLTTSRWRKLALWAGIGAAIAVAAIAIRALVMTAAPSDPQLERARAKQAELAQIAEQRTARIAALRRVLAQRCDSAEMEELRHLLVLDGKIDASQSVQADYSNCR